MNLLSAQNLSHSFEYQLFSNVSLDLYAKESIAIIGMSGSGKSTLLHLLSSLLQPDEGEVKILVRSGSCSANELSLWLNSSFSTL